MLKPIFLAAALAFVPPAAAQDTQPLSDPLPLLDEARTAIGANEWSHARRAAESAVKAIVAKEGEIIRSFLPPPLDGWTATDGEAASLGLVSPDAGVTVTRTYGSSDGLEVRIEILADSLVVEQMSAIYTDPAMAGAAGIKTETINGETAMVEPNTGQITVLIGNRTSVTVTGSNPEISRAYAEKVNYAGLKEMK